MGRSWVYTSQSTVFSDQVNIKNADQQGHSVGKGMFVEKAINANTVICSVSEPLVLALDNERLEDTCYNCHSQSQELTNSLFATQDQTTSDGQTLLKVCTGCRVVRYCSRLCQKSSWTAIHRLECSLYGKYSPRLMPNHMRAIVRLIQMRTHDRLTKKQWDEFMECPSHINHITQRRDDELTKLIRSAHATVELTPANLDFNTVLQMYCILKINSITLMPAWFDPLGLYMHPFLAKINHSCDPNAYIRFPLSKTPNTAIEVVALRDLDKDEEITICYIEENKPYEMRQAQLQNQYFFTCSCSKCTSDKAQPNLPGTQLNANQRRTIGEVETKTGEAESGSASTTAVQAFTQALQLLVTSEWPNQLYPYPQVLQKLIVACIDEQKYDYGMAYALIQHFDVDPVVYKTTVHPIRLIHHYTLVRLMNYMCDVGDSSLLLQQLYKKQEVFSSDRDLLPWWRSYLGAKLREHATIVYGDGPVLNRIVNDSEDINPAWPVVKPGNVSEAKYEEMSKRIREVMEMAYQRLK